MTVTQLEYIVALDTYRHYVTASKHCNVTQPALTAQVKKLEQELGVRIFDRSRKPLVPTEIGEKIIEQAKVVLQQLRKIPDMIEQESAELRGELRLGILPTVSPYLVPIFVNRFTAEFAEVRLRIIERSQSNIIKELKDGRLDAGIMTSPVRDQSILTEELFADPILLYVHEEHELHNRESIEPKAIPLEDLWLLTHAHNFRHQVDQLLGIIEPAEQVEGIQYESHSFEGLLRMVDAVKGLTLLPKLATLQFNSKQKQRLRPIDGHNAMRHVVLAYSRADLKRNLLEEVNSSVRNALPKDF